MTLQLAGWVGRTTRQTLDEKMYGRALRSNSTTVQPESTSSNKSVIVAVTNGAPAMADEIDKEFASHREMFPTEEDKKAFDQLVKQLLEKHGVDYVRGYVDALKDMQKRKAS